MKAEFEKRNLDIGITISDEIDNYLNKITEQVSTELFDSKKITENFWPYIFFEKERGWTDFVIYYGLLYHGVKEQDALWMLQNLEKKAKELLDKHDNDIILKWILLAIALFLFFFFVNGILKEFNSIAGIFLVLSGLFMLNESYTKRDKYQKIVNNIIAEQKAVDEQSQ